jgi:hypothetical protein
MKPNRVLSSSILQTSTPARALVFSLALSAFRLFGGTLVWHYRYPSARSAGKVVTPPVTDGRVSEAMRKEERPGSGELGDKTMERPVQSLPLEKAQLMAISVHKDMGRVFVGFQLSQPTQFEVHRLKQPERIYIDFRQTQLVPDWLRPPKVPNHLIKAVRSSVTSERARIVFDLARPVEFLVVGPNANHRIVVCFYTN